MKDLEKAMKNVVDHMSIKDLLALSQYVPDKKVITAEDYFRIINVLGTSLSYHVEGRMDRPNYSDAECDFYNKEK